MVVVVVAAAIAGLTCLASALVISVGEAPWNQSEQNSLGRSGLTSASLMMDPWTWVRCLTHSSLGSGAFPLSTASKPRLFFDMYT